MDNIDESLSLTAVELKRKNLRNVLSVLRECSSSVLMFSLQWKDVDDHYQSLHDALEKREKEVRDQEESVRQRIEREFQEREKELEEKEKKIKDLEEFVQYRQRYLSIRCQDVELKRNELSALDESMTVMCRNMELRECEFSQKMASVLEAKGREIDDKVKAFEVVKREIVEGLKEIEKRERRVERVFGEKERELKRREKKLENLRKNIGKREREIECKEKEIGVRCQEMLQEAERKETELEVRYKKQFDWLELRNREIEKEVQRVGLDSEKLKERCEENEMLERKLEERVKEVGMKEKRLEELSEKLDLRKGELQEGVNLKEQWLEERFEEFSLEKLEFEKQFNEAVKEVGMKEKRLEELSEKLELRKGELEEGVNLKEQWLEQRFEEFSLEKLEFKKRFDEAVKEVGMKEKRLEELSEKLELCKGELEEGVSLKEQWLEGWFEEFSLEKLEFEKRFNEAVEKEKDLSEWAKKLEMRENQYQEGAMETDAGAELVNYGVGKVVTVDLERCVVIDGKALQILLNEHWKKHENIRDMVSALLRMCSDPAMLVLDAIEGFYPPHLTHGDCNFEAGVIRSSCLLLLELLIEIGPNIKPPVRGKAMELSSDWITKMTVDSEHSMEIVALLVLLSAYGLADAYAADKLVDYAENVAHYEQIPWCCQALGLNEKIPDLIRNLLKRKQHHVALELINEFNLIEEFSPNSIIEDFMEPLQSGAEEIIMEENHYIEAQE